MKRQTYEMSEEQYEALQKASCKALEADGNQAQENADLAKAWAKLGSELDFDFTTVELIPTQSEKSFTAIPLSHKTDDGNYWPEPTQAETEKMVKDDSVKDIITNSIEKMYLAVEEIRNSINDLSEYYGGLDPFSDKFKLFRKTVKVGNDMKFKLIFAIECAEAKRYDETIKVNMEAIEMALKFNALKAELKNT